MIFSRERRSSCSRCRAHSHRPAVPGTPVPSFLQNIDQLKKKGVDTHPLVAVNDAFVMNAWAKDQGSGGKVVMLADGSGQFTKALGLELDLNARGLGTRSQRYALVAEGGEVPIWASKRLVTSRSAVPNPFWSTCKRRSFSVQAPRERGRSSQYPI